MDDVAWFGRLVGLLVGRVLERHPAVARFGQAAHHPGVQLASGDLALVETVALRLEVSVLELLAEEIDEMGNLLRVEQGPLPVLLDTLHEEVGNPVGEIQVVGALSTVAGVVLQLEERLDVGVPGLEVHARRALATATLVDRSHRTVESLEPRDDAVGQPVRSLDEGPPAADPRVGEPDATGVLRQPGYVAVPVVDGVEIVLGRVQEVAAGHLGVRRAAVEEGRRRREVFERGDQPVELDRLLGCRGETARHPHEEVLRSLDHLAGLGVAEQVAVVHGAEPEELVQSVALGDDGVVELARMGGHHERGLVTDDPLDVAEAHRLAERVHVALLDLLVDDGRQHPGREARVAGLFHDEGRCRAYRHLVELLGGRPVVEPRDRAGGHPHHVDTGQHRAVGVGRRSADGRHDLVEVDGLEASVAFCEPASRCRPRRRSHRSVRLRQESACCLPEVPPFALPSGSLESGGPDVDSSRLPARHRLEPTPVPRVNSRHRWSTPVDVRSSVITKVKLRQ